MDLITRLSFLFGTEEALKRRRQLVLLREKLLNESFDDRDIVICSGSLGEGVAYPPSDDDLMYVSIRTNALVYESYDEAMSQRALYMMPSEYSPGFCLIQDTKGEDILLIASKLFREGYVRQQPDCYLHGPCASRTIRNLEFDYAPCLFCPRWPGVANEWITRMRRYGWPPRDLAETIVRAGCHFVPIGNADSPLCDMEWRVSFSLAERSLIHSFSHVQFIVYNLLKLILKRVIETQVPNALCSYFLKTVLFYTIENTRPDIFVKDALDLCYRQCLLLLYNFIDARTCPNYFIPDNNMMRRKVNANNRVPLLRIVNMLIRRGIVGSLYLCDKMESHVLCPFLSLAKCELQGDLSFLFEYLFQVFMSDFQNIIEMQRWNDACCRAATKVLTPILSGIQPEPTNSLSSVLYFIIRKLFTLMGLQCIRSASVTVGNASRYKILKYAQSMLKLGLNTDVSSGRLHLANYMFVTGRIRQCLAIIQGVLSRMAPYVITDFLNNVEKDMYREVICNNDYSLDYKVRKAWALGVEFSDFSEREESAPLPIKILFSVMKHVATNTYRNDLPLHPVVFAYYLQGFCFFRTRDFNSMDISVTLLETTVRYLPSNSLYKIFSSRLLLSHMKTLQQDYRAACRCITSAYFTIEQLSKKYKWNHSDGFHACIILLACLVNRSIPNR